MRSTEADLVINGGATDALPANHPLRGLRALLEPLLQPGFARDAVEEVRLSSVLTGPGVATLQLTP